MYKVIVVYRDGSAAPYNIEAETSIEAIRKTVNEIEHRYIGIHPPIKSIKIADSWDKINDD